MKTKLTVIVSVILFSAAFIPAKAQQNRLFVWGNAKWISGAAAVGVEVRLISGDQVRARAYTNQGGRYFFFDVSGKPSDYSLVVVIADIVRGRTSIPTNVNVGHKAPDLRIR